MNRIRHALLIFLMLCSMCIIFVVQTGTALADGGYTCTGEYDCGYGSTTSNQPTTVCESGGSNGQFHARDGGFCPGSSNGGGTQGGDGGGVSDFIKGVIAGKEAKNNNGSPDCPSTYLYNSQFCRGYRSGYNGIAGIFLR